MDGSAEDRIRRIARPWRVGVVLYAVALSVATHWPELELGTVEQPAPDKILHLVAFGWLAIMLAQARWLRQPWQVIAIAIAWTAVDEVTQAIPVLGRTFSFQDMVAGQLGVLLVGAWWWALSPVGGRGNRARLAMWSFVIADLLSDVRAWAVTAACAGAGAAVVGAAVVLLLRRFGGGEPVLATVLASSLAGAAAGAHAAITGMGRRRAKALADLRPCFRCGGSCRAAVFDDEGTARCMACGGPIRRGQWELPPDQPLPTVRRGAARAVSAAAMMLTWAILLYVLVLVLSVRVGAARALSHGWMDLAPDMQLALDLTWIGAALAVGARLYRRSQADLHDRQHERCRACLHDLTRTETHQGVGRCPECGTVFAKY